MSIDFDLLDNIALITINRPESRNALDLEHYEALSDAWSRVRDDNDIRAAIVTGAGDKAFCAGADLKERKGMSDTDWTRQHAILEQAIRAIMDCPVPVTPEGIHQI